MPSEVSVLAAAVAAESPPAQTHHRHLLEPTVATVPQVLQLQIRETMADYQTP